MVLRRSAMRSNHHATRIPSSTCRLVLVVIALWLVVTLFTVSITFKHGDYDKSIYVQLIKNSYASAFYSKTTMPHELPTFREVDDADERTQIFLDWPLTDELFSAHNYKSLESILHNYPHAVVRCIVVGPKEISALKIDRLLSANQFIKYSKLNYDISVIPVDTRKKSSVSQLGSKYRDKWFFSCCYSCGNKCSEYKSPLAPYHLLNYVRLMYLWRKGGIFSDFSFYFLSPLPETVQEGYFMESYCTAINARNNSTLRDPVFHPSSFDSWQSLTCYTSTLLVFRKKRSSIVECMLKKYDEDAAFLLCIESDNFYGGAECVKKAFQQCFAQHEAENAFESAEMIEVFGHDPNAALATLLSRNWTINANTRVLWMGQLAWTQRRQQYPHPHPYPYPPETLLDKANARNSLRTLRDMGLRDTPQRGAATTARRAFLVGAQKSGVGRLYRQLLNHPQVLPSLCGARGYEKPSRIFEGSLRTCSVFLEDSPHSADHAFLSLYLGSATEQIMKRTPGVRVAVYLSHPVLRAVWEVHEILTELDGAGRLTRVGKKKRQKLDGDGRAKTTKRLREEPSQSALTIDGVLYEVLARRDSGILQIWRKAKEILLRAELNATSDHSPRQQETAQLEELSALYYQLVGPDESADQPTRNTSSPELLLLQRVERALLSSVYLPVVQQHLAAAAERDSVQVFFAEELYPQEVQQNSSLGRNQSVTQRLFAYLQLSETAGQPDSASPAPAGRPEDFLSLLHAREEVAENIRWLLESRPANERLSMDMFLKLCRFFRAFNALLAQLLQREIGELWPCACTSEPSTISALCSAMPVFALERNTSWPLLWFEDSEGLEGMEDSSYSRVHPLLPFSIKRSIEDSSYNTTLGMLSTF